MGLRLISNFVLGQVKLVEHTELTPLAGLDFLCIIKEDYQEQRRGYNQKIQINVWTIHSKLHVNSMKIFASNVNVKVNKSIKYIQLYKINKITYI